MDRRNLLRALGAAATITLLPKQASAAWARVASLPANAPLQYLTPQWSEQLASLADTIIPRTDTPSATDVGVIQWIDVVLGEYYNDTEKKAFNDGMGAVHGIVKSGAVPLPAYTPESNAALIEIVEKRDRRTDDAARGWWRFKGLVMQGYFTSQKVMQDVLEVSIMPGKFVGDAPHVVRARS